MDVIIDLETTGPDFDKGDRIIQIGCVFIDNEKIVDEMNSYVNPQRPIPEEISDLTGIHQNDVQSAPYFDELAPSLYKLLKNCRVIAHNVGFDFPFLKKCFAAMGLTDFQPELLDTVELAQILYPNLRRYKLELLAEDLGLGDFAAHSAIEDAKMTAQIYIQCRRKIRSLPRPLVEQLIHFSEGSALYVTPLLKELVKACQPLTKDASQWERLFPHVITRRKLLDPKATLTLEDYFAQPSLQHVMHKHLREAQIDQPIYQVSLMPAEQGEVATLPGKHAYDYILTLLNRGEKLLTLMAHEDQLTSWLVYLQKEKPTTSTGVLHLPESYVDLYRLEQVLSSPLDFNRFERIVLMGLLVWLTETSTGDLSGLQQLNSQRHLLYAINCRINDTSSTSTFWQQVSRLSRLQAVVMTQKDFYKMEGQLPSELTQRFLVGLGMDQTGKLIREAVRCCYTHTGDEDWPFSDLQPETGSALQLSRFLPENGEHHLLLDSRLRYHLDSLQQKLYVMPIPMQAYVKEWVEKHKAQPMLLFMNGEDVYGEWKHFKEHQLRLKEPAKRSVAVWAKKLKIAEEERSTYLAQAIQEFQAEDCQQRILVVCHSYDFLRELYDKIKKLGLKDILSQTVNKRDVFIRQLVKDHSVKIILMTLTLYESSAHLLPTVDRSILSKLPFEALDAPVQLMAKDYYQSISEDYFSAFQVPTMVKHLETFIRNASVIGGSKKGIILFDPRLLRQSYGRVAQNVLENWASFYREDGHQAIKP